MKKLMCIVLSLGACSLAGAADIQPAIDEFNALHFDNARQLFIPLAKDGQHEKQASYYLGRIAIATTHYEDAKRYLEKSVAIQPNSADELYWLGTAYINLMQGASLFSAPGLLSNFRKNTEAALTLAPNHLPALMGLYQYNINAPAIAGGSMEKAGQLLTRIESVSKPYADIARLSLLNKNKEADKAIALAQTMIAAHPESHEALFEAGKTLSNNKRFPEALAALEKVATLTATPDNYPRVQGAYFEIGQACWRKRDELDRGIAALTKATDAKRFPVNNLTNWSYFRLAQLYQLKGDAVQQKKYLELLEKTGVEKDKVLVKTMESQMASNRMP